MARKAFDEDVDDVKIPERLCPSGRDQAKGKQGSHQAMRRNLFCSRYGDRGAGTTNPTRVPGSESTADKRQKKMQISTKKEEDRGRGETDQ